MEQRTTPGGLVAIVTFLSSLMINDCNKLCKIVQ